MIQAKSDGAVNFTASHNPPDYNGIKFSTPDGAPALPAVTARIEAEIAAYDASSSSPKKRVVPTSPPAESLDPRRMYLARLRDIVDVGTVKKAGLRVAFDPLWGAARGYSDALLREAGVAVGTVHDYRDVLFGGHAPEPDDHLLDPMREKMREMKAHLGIATDGDADRFRKRREPAGDPLPCGRAATGMARGDPRRAQALSRTRNRVRLSPEAGGLIVQRTEIIVCEFASSPLVR